MEERQFQIKARKKNNIYFLVSLQFCIRACFIVGKCHVATLNNVMWADLPECWNIDSPVSVLEQMEIFVLVSKWEHKTEQMFAGTSRSRWAKLTIYIVNSQFHQDYSLFKDGGPEICDQ